MRHRLRRCRSTDTEYLVLLIDTRYLVAGTFLILIEVNLFPAKAENLVCAVGVVVLPALILG